jgi:Concanavalin A-like lectin/glucanases superfamily
MPTTSAATFTVKADFDGDGVYETELASRINESGVQVSRGFNSEGLYQAGKCTIDLDNGTGAFTPQNKTSPYYGKWKRGVPIQVTMSFASRTYVFFTGYLTRPKVSGSGKPSMMRATGECHDVGLLLNESPPINLTVSLTRRFDDVVRDTLTALGFAANDMVLDRGMATFPVHFARDQMATPIIADAQRAEMYGWFYPLADGRLRAESRNSRLGISPYRQLVRRDAPVAYWRFGEASGTAAKDSSDRGNTGTYVGTPTLGVTGLVGGGDPNKAVTLNGTTQWITVPDGADLDLGDVFTFSCWFKRGATGTRQTFFDKGVGWGSVFIETDNLVKFEKNGTALIVVSTVTITDTASPHHLMVTKSGAAVKLYIDGVDRTGSVSNQTLTNTATNLFIGATTGSANPWNGALDEAAFYNFAMTAEQAYEHYTIGLNGRVWGDGTSILPEEVEVEQVDEDLVTTVSVSPVTYTIRTEGEIVYEDERNKRAKPVATSRLLAAGQVIRELLPYDGMAVSLVTPVAYTDYEANDAADGSSNDRTGAVTIIIADLGGAFERVTTNTHSAAVYLTESRQRATRYEQVQTTGQYVLSKSIPGFKSGRGVQLQVPFTNDDVSVVNYAYGILRAGRYPYYRARLTFAWTDDAIVDHMAMLELGDMVRFSDLSGGAEHAWLTNVNEYWYVEHIDHPLPPYGPRGVRKTVVTLVPSHLYRNHAAVVWDDFDRANVVGDLGVTKSLHTWANDAGFDIASNKARPNAVTAQIPDVDVGVPDMVVEGTWSNLASDTDELVGVTARKADANNYLRAYVSDVADAVILDKVVAGVVTQVGSVALTLAASHEVQLMCQGTRVRVAIDQIPRIDATVTELTTNTKAGPYVLNIATCDLDDFYAQGLSPS